MKVLMDCDPGVDDAIALFLLLAQENVDILGLTAVAGNVGLEHTYRNLRDLSALAGRADIPVYAGMAAPLARPLWTAAEVHGAHGMGGVTLPSSDAPHEGEDAVHATCRLLEAADEPVVWIATGPLTNVAVALSLRPSIKDKVSRLVVMGGSTVRGNVTPAAEFNVYADPEAWRVVLESGIEFTMVGLNVTDQVCIDESDLNAYKAMGSRVASTAAAVLEDYVRNHVDEGFGGAPVHDAVAVAAALHPDLLRTEVRGVEVETQGRATLGMTVVDMRPGRAGKGNCRVGMEPNAAAIRNLMRQALASYGKHS